MQMIGSAATPVGKITSACGKVDHFIARQADGQQA